MKRKFWLVSSILITVLVLGACASKKAPKETAASSTETSEPITESTEKTEVSEHSVLKGVLKENASVDGEKVSLFIIDVEGLTDPTDLAKGIGEEGVILNAETSQIDGEFAEEDYQAGQEIEVTLDSNAVMARSMPPQIPGMSIISIKKL